MKKATTFQMVPRVMIMFLLVLMSGMLFAQAVPEYMYYKFDAAGNQQNYASAPVGNNPAVLSGLTVGGTGQFGTALVGNGGASGTNTLSTGWATNMPSAGWTVSFWINNQPSNTDLYYLWGDINANSFRCFIGGAAGAGNILLRGGGLTDVTVNGVAPGPTVVTFVYTGTSIKQYKNGVPSGTTAQPSAGITGSGPFLVGGYSTLTGMMSGALMDEFRMWNRALSDAEVLQVWNISLPGGPPPTTGTLSGTVTSAIGNFPIAGATVSVGTANTTTAANGTYTLTVPVGTSTAQCAAAGFVTQTASVTITAGGTTTKNWSMVQAAGNTTVIVGTGTSTSTYPYTTYWMGGRTQILYRRADIAAAGGAAGNISKIGFNVSSYSSQVMNGFQVRMAPTTATSITSYQSGLTTYLSGTYAVPGTGWQDLTLTTPFVWDGTSNILVDVCYANTSYTTYSYVYAHATNSDIVGYYADVQTACTTTTNNSPSYTPNIRFTISTVPGGFLTGTVTSAATSAPISGATITVNTMNPVTTNTSGVYSVLNIAPATVNVTCKKAGFIDWTGTAVITSATITTLNIQMMPNPSLKGTVTDASTGLPIVGATIQIDNNTNPVVDMSVGGGTYGPTPVPYVGSHTIIFNKTGYEQLSVGPINLVANTVITVDAALLPAAVQPGPFTAAYNNPTTPTAINLNWGIPQAMYQIIYDDGTQDNFAIWGAANNLNALKFTPLAWPVKLVGGKINIGTSANYPANVLPFNSFYMLACKADGSGGMPGTVLDSIQVTPTDFGWVDFTFAVPLTINSGDFYLVMKQGGIPPHAAGVGVDLTNTQLRSYSKYVTGGAPWIPAAGNFMMRAIVQGTGGPMLTENPTANKNLITASAPDGLIYESPVSTVSGYEGTADYPAITPTYQVWRLQQGQESNQALWTSLWTGAATTTVDNGWPSLACGPYRWAVKAIYSPPGQRFSAPTFSNVLGKCWTANVNVCVTLTCAANAKAGTLVKLTNVNYPDTVYSQMTDTSGCVHFTNVWKGTYDMTATRFTYPVTTQQITVMGDMNLTITMLQNTDAPTGIYVDDKSLYATWHPPRAAVLHLNENWSSGSFATNGWATSGGTNWSVVTGTGNPAPAAEFNYYPEVLNYNQYLTSKSMAGIHAPAMRLKYDIYLSNYGTSNVNTMAVELWNGTAWSVLKTYTNSGNIAWTSENLDISSVTNAPDFRIRFHAAGTDSWDINNWDIDNIQVLSTDGTSGPNPCVLGYNFYLNNVLSFYTPDTTYYIPPNLVVYNTTYQACVKAIFGSGYSNANCTTFVAHFLYPARNLVATPIECNTYLTWEKPQTVGDGPGDYQGYVPVTNVQPAAEVATHTFAPTTASESKSLSSTLDAPAQVLVDNGPLVNSPGTGSGGADESILYSPLTIYGFGAQQASGNSMADDFIVPTGQTWSVNKLTFYSYQTGSGGTSTITGLFCQIYNGDPTSGGTVIWGDMTTNRMTATSFSNIYRTQAVGGGTDRPIMKVEGAVTGLTLTAGTYWVEYQFTGSGSSGPWAPPITITGTNVTGNGKQHTSSGWQNAMDGSYQQGLPFIIEGSNGSGGGGQTPYGLKGYNVYRDNTKIKTILSPDTLFYYDYNLNPGTYKYDVKALYDLTTYGIPTPPSPWGESLMNTAGLQQVTLHCGAPLPFYEPWDQGNFTFQSWTIPTSGSHWSINTGIGNPAPSADFQWQTAIANYSQAITSEVIDASAWTCADIWLDFDYKLIDHNATGKEKLTVDVYYNNAWHQKSELTNNGTTGWLSKHIDITSVKGKSFRIRFTANGVNSADILHWYVDNIHAYGICKAPTALHGTQSQFTTTLTWTAPACGPAGTGGTVTEFIFDDGTWENGWTMLAGNLGWFGNEFPIATTTVGVIQKVKLYFVDNGSGSVQNLSIDFYNSAQTLIGSSASFSAGPFNTWLEVPINDVPFTGKFYAMVKFDNLPAQSYYLASDENGPYAAQDLGWNINSTGVWAKASTLGANPCVFLLRATALVTSDKKSVELVPATPNPAGVRSDAKASQIRMSGDSHDYSKMSMMPSNGDSTSISGYNVYRTGDGSALPFTKLNSSPVTATTYVDVHSVTNTTWKYFVTAILTNSEDQTVLCEPSSDTITISTVGMNELTNGQIMVYPNPATQIVNVKSDFTINRIDVINYAGQTVYSNTVDSKTAKFDVTAFTAGVYFVKVTTTEGVRAVKITVVH